MASTNKPLTKNVWTKITDTDKNGSIRHKSGNTQVAYVEAATAPTSFDENTAIMEDTYMRDEWTYFSVPAADFVWAYAVSADAVLVVTPAEV